MIATVYRTGDGEIFENQITAEEHDKKLFRKWLTETKVGLLCDAVLGTMDNTKDEEYWGTEKDMALVFVRQAYRMNQLKLDPCDEQD